MVESRGNKFGERENRTIDAGVIENCKYYLIILHGYSQNLGQLILFTTSCISIRIIFLIMKKKNKDSTK